MRGKLRLQSKIIVLEVALLLAVIAVTALSVLYLADDSLEEQVGERALDIARTVAVMPGIQEAFYSQNPITLIAPVADRIRRSTGADFVIVTDRGGTRFSHPLPDWLGKATASLDYGPALMEGREYYTRIQESPGPALAGIAPIYGRDGELIGLVSAGFNLRDIRLLTWKFGRRMLVIALAGLVVGIAGAILLARNIKRDIFGLEPPEIARVLEERDAILHSIREGIVAIDGQARVTVLNGEAKRLIGLKGDAIGCHILELIPNSRLPEMLVTARAQYDQEMIIGDTVAVANRVPLIRAGRVVGAVSSFRDRTELNRLANALTEVRKYSETLRAQAHEFKNRLHTIAGLIQLGASDEALDFIFQVEAEHQYLLDLLDRVVPDPTVAAIILGKYNRASELHVRLALDPVGTFREGPSRLDPNLLVTVLGNLIDNAIEAVKDLPEVQRWIWVSLDDSGPEIVIVVSDGGPGVPEELRELIFEEGFSTKEPEGRGIGLALVRGRVAQAGGCVEVGDDPRGGARFTVRFPGRGRKGPT